MKRNLNVTAAGLAVVAAGVLLVPVAASGLSSATSVKHPVRVRRAAALSDRGGQPVAFSAPKGPRLRARVVMRGLDHPWDIAILPGGSWLVTERDRERILLRTPSGKRRVLADSPSGFWHAGETGLMSIVADPGVERNNRFYTCNGFSAGGSPEIRVTVWRLNDARTAASRVGPLLTGIETITGRHGGCRLRFSPRGALYVSTGDAAVGTNPQNLHSLNGKVLRLNRFTGKPWPTNPWAHAKNAHKRYIYTYGHRNVQGLSYRPHDRMWAVEQGTDRNDEVNRLFAGANYGWDPGPGYDETTPMTDFSLPGRQRPAHWRSGYPTLATSGGRWVLGPRWGAYRGTLAVCTLKASELLFMKFDQSGHLQWVRIPAVMKGTYGRLRTPVETKSGALLITTDNGGGNDKIIRLTPR